jgi:hypothetical protein
MSINELNAIICNHKVSEAPHTMKLAGPWKICTVAIGKDHTATLLIDNDSLEELAHMESDLKNKPLEIWLGTGDKLISDIYADDGSYAGIGIFNTENEKTYDIGEHDGKPEGIPLDKKNAIVLIRSTCVKSLRVLAERIQQSINRMEKEQAK